jgi:hypothetical protein
MQVVEMSILATDLASYFNKRHKFLSIADAGEIDWQVGQGPRKSCSSVAIAQSMFGQIFNFGVQNLLHL